VRVPSSYSPIIIIYNYLQLKNKKKKIANCSLSSLPSQSDLSDAYDVIFSNELLKERLEPFSGKLTLYHLNFHSLRSSLKSSLVSLTHRD
jgi:hypothetical protein